jgi:hypothetical protein
MNKVKLMDVVHLALKELPPTHHALLECSRDIKHYEFVFGKGSDIVTGFREKREQLIILAELLECVVGTARCKPPYTEEQVNALEELVQYYQIKGNSREQ